jgi:hypothetical protein
VALRPHFDAQSSIALIVLLNEVNRIGCETTACGHDQDVDLRGLPKSHCCHQRGDIRERYTSSEAGGTL